MRVSVQNGDRTIKQISVVKKDTRDNEGMSKHKSLLKDYTEHTMCSQSPDDSSSAPSVTPTLWWHNKSWKTSTNASPHHEKPGIGEEHANAACTNA